MNLFRVAFDQMDCRSGSGEPAGSHIEYSCSIRQAKALHHATKSQCPVIGRATASLILRSEK